MRYNQWGICWENDKGDFGKGQPIFNSWEEARHYVRELNRLYYPSVIHFVYWREPSTEPSALNLAQTPESHLMPTPFVGPSQKQAGGSVKASDSNCGPGGVGPSTSEDPT